METRRTMIRSTSLGWLDEHNYFTPGNERVIIEHKGVRFCPQICYDLRFPIWSRNSDGKSKIPIYDCLIYVANWPKVRSDAWTSLLKARAIENQAFVVGVNRVGLDGNGIEYSGDSRFFSPKGDRLDQVISCKEMISIVTMDLTMLNEFVKIFQYLMMETCSNSYKQNKNQNLS